MERKYEKTPVAEPLEDEDSHKTYTIYRITTPNGKVYVGYPERYSAYISMRNETNKRNREMRKNLLNSKENT